MKSPFEKLLDRLIVLPSGCWVTGRLGHYSQVFDPSSQVPLLGHRVMWQHYNGPVADGFDVHHRCGMKPCVNPEHLELIDRAEHARQHARENAVLTPEQVEEAHRLYASGRSMRSIGRQYGVHHRTISRVLNGRSAWAAFG